MSDLNLWHPRFVHFAIALLSVSLLCEIIWRITKKELFREIAEWNLIFAGAGVAMTFITGLIAEDAVTISGAAKETFENHETLGWITFIITGFLLVWRLYKNGEWYRKFATLFLIVYIAAFLSVSIGGYLGGKLVYTYGVGVGSGKSATIPATPAPVEKNEN